MNFKRISFRPNESEQALLEQVASSTGSQSVTETIRNLLANLPNPQGIRPAYHADKSGRQSAKMITRSSNPRGHSIQATDGSMMKLQDIKISEEHPDNESMVDMEMMHNLMMRVAHLDRVANAQREKIGFLEEQSANLQRQQLQQQIQQQTQQPMNAHQNPVYNGLSPNDFTGSNVNYPSTNSGLADRTSRIINQVMKDTEMFAKWKRDFQIVRGW